MKKVKKISEFSLMGGLGIAVVLALNGCNKAQETQEEQNIAVKNGAFVVIEEQEDGTFKILEEYPSESTRVLLKAKDGTERMLSNKEIDKLLKDEEKAIDAGTSQLTNPNGTGLSLGGAILASAAGAIIGSWIGNKLFGNQNYQTQQRTSYKSPQAYERSQNSFNNAKSGGAKATNTGRSGFFGGGNNEKRNNAIGG